MSKLKFKPKHVTKRLLGALPERSRAILVYRYGLDDSIKPHTLDAIGGKYGVTRERIRQIENNSINNIRKSEQYRSSNYVFEELHNFVDNLGAVVEEKHLLSNIDEKKDSQNHALLLLILGDTFEKHKEDDDFQHRWNIDKNLSSSVYAGLRSLHNSIPRDKLFKEEEMISNLFGFIKDEVDLKYHNDEIMRRWLLLSKKLAQNPLGEWGSTFSPNVRAKGIRDYAYLAIKKQGSPMHFTEVAKSIRELFERDAHEATCHNELIKDGRFVLVGRGLYALSEWGYSSGVVKDVIRDMINKYGPLSKQEIIEHVKKERYVKDNTILVNLQDAKSFKRDESGRYRLSY